MEGGLVNGEIRILMLEDNPDDAKLIELALRRARITFASLRVSAREEFAQALDTFKPDIILADYRLPAFDGLSAVTMVRQTHPQVPVIMVTGALGDEGAVALLSAGAKDYILKDRLARLGPAVLRALSAEQGIRNRKLAEAKFRAIFSQARDGIVLLDCDTGYIAECNPEFERISGRTFDELKGRGIWEAHPAEEKYQEARNAFFEVVHAGGGNNFELPLRKPDGEVVHSEINISVMRLQDRCYIQCIVRDITERKRLELALEENEHRLEEMFEHMSSGVAVYRVSPDGQTFFINSFNSAAERLENIRREAVVGKDVAEAFPGIAEFGLLDVFRRVHESGVAEHFPVTFYQDGRIAGWRENYVYKLPNGEVVAIYNDITEEKQEEEKMHQLAHYDMLTGLPNRTLFADRLQQAIAVAKRSRAHLALLFLDLDNFKPVNDTLGHAVGDLLLQEVAKRILECVREEDTVSRLGGDEFVVLLISIEAEPDALHVADKIRQALNQPFVLAGNTLNISTSTGIALYPEHGREERILLKNADAAMYQAKKNGRNNVKVYRPEPVRT